MNKLSDYLQTLFILCMVGVWMTGFCVIFHWVRHYNDVPTCTQNVSVLVRPGDSIAGLICEKLDEYQDRRDYREIVRLTKEKNNLTSSIIYPGQVLIIPFEVPCDEEK